MSGNYTLKDFLTYFFAGFFAMLLSVIAFFEILVSMNEVISKNKEILIFLSIPCCYILGHIVHGLDSSIGYRISKKVIKLRKKNPNKFFAFLHKLLSSHRLIGIQANIWTDDHDLIIREIIKQRVNKQLEGIEYWSVLNDMFKGFIVVLIIFIGIAIWKQQYLLMSIYLVLLLLFWDRAKLFGYYYIRGIKNRHEIFGEKVN